ncbi:hypothetical protein P606_11590 [Comamonas thiooxydans]|uniref:Uncharacterized protein n=1 Tax=Comamonas thiooxydans TaxID=363952 RepID=A0A0E3BVK4_9BURK|nr:hypothetical protein P245_24730 [Comamonas thiooxydans]KGH23553.1 hypothetical protein P606_11590 [Comamonas thiooxydans]
MLQTAQNTIEMLIFWQLVFDKACLQFDTSKPIAFCGAYTHI